MAQYDKYLDTFAGVFCMAGVTVTPAIGHMRKRALFPYAQRHEQELCGTESIPRYLVENKVLKPSSLIGFLEMSLPLEQN